MWPPDRRIGKYGTKAGKPFDGACLPKDTVALASFAKRLQISPDLLQVVLDINKKVGEMAELQQVYERLSNDCVQMSMSKSSTFVLL